MTTKREPTSVFGFARALKDLLDIQNNRVAFNPGQVDVDFRVEGNNNANMIFMDAGDDTISFGGAKVDGAAAVFNNLTDRTAITSVGTQVHLPAQTQNFDNGSSTIAVGAYVFIGGPTFTGDTATLTMTEGVTLYIAGSPTGGSNVTVTNAYALKVASGTAQFGNVEMRSGGNTKIGGTAAHGTAGANIISLYEGTAPASTLANGASIFADVVTSDEVLRGIDSAGNVTTL